MPGITLINLLFFFFVTYSRVLIKKDLQTFHVLNVCLTRLLILKMFTDCSHIKINLKKKT